MNLNNIDLNKLAVFAQVVEAGTYRLASERLNVTPSALSQTITGLERSLGVPLFERIGKRLVPTPLGLEIRRSFRAHREAFQDELTRIAGRAREVTGLLRIGAYLEFAKFRLAPVLAEFQREHPDVQVKMVFEPPSRLHRMLEADKLDVCFSIYPERDRLVRSRAIYTEELVLVAPEGRLGPRPTVEELLEVPMIEYYFNHQPIRRWLALHYRKKPKTLPIRTYASTAEMVLALARAGLGAGVVPAYLLEGTGGTEGLTVVRPSPRKLIDHIWMLRRKVGDASTALGAFTARIESAFGDEA